MCWSPRGSSRPELPFAGIAGLAEALASASGADLPTGPDADVAGLIFVGDEPSVVEAFDFIDDGLLAVPSGAELALVAA